MSYWAIDHWAFAFVWIVVLLFMVRTLLGGKKLWRKRS